MKIMLGNREIYLGHAEVWVPSPDQRLTYAAPDLIWHYVTAHGYLPPKEFQEAVLQFDLSCDWSGDAQLERLREDAWRRAGY